VVVLALFVPLCISTGGNSGSQAATLVTRSMALGFVNPRDWKRVLRRELLMGLALGLALGLIAFVRGALTFEDTRGGPRKVHEPFAVRVPTGTELTTDKRGDVAIDAGAAQTVTMEKNTRIRLPHGEAMGTPEKQSDGWLYQFPAECEVRTEPVNRWALAQVIAISVMGICLWGTLIGSMLPLAFRKLGIDPALASSAFVATFVDVTGIFIFFSIATFYLL
jgi:magnesium transporter